RYLWTDAFAVCGFLGLHDQTGEDRFIDLALRLVDDVHHTLGRHRPDDPRKGWISGLAGPDGERRPTVGGLRIGKPEPERPAGEAYHPGREWDRDGQYYHYLTRWMHALNRVWRVTGDRRFHGWAVDLAAAAHRGFVADGRMVWKMSVDLGRPLVPSMGQHDPLDGRILIETLRATAPDDTDRDELLRREARELDDLCRGASWVTHDGLGVGGLLVDGLRMVQLREAGRVLPAELQERVFSDAARGLGFFALTYRSDVPPGQRLAFRELGLAIGIHAAERIADAATVAPPDPQWLRTIDASSAIARDIEELWTGPAARTADTWTAHEDINAVMLAAALEPHGYLDL
ncbi:MAG: hypothetical protein KY466_02270, partial [Gemmatimonadetes bacterium]|nr:hypothetical protein [Gemmatimonadota bacterium]